MCFFFLSLFSSLFAMLRMCKMNSVDYCDGIRNDENATTPHQKLGTLSTTSSEGAFTSLQVQSGDLIPVDWSIVVVFVFHGRISTHYAERKALRNDCLGRTWSSSFSRRQMPCAVLFAFSFRRHASRAASRSGSVVY